jgi:hypothetical protein
VPKTLEDPSVAKTYSPRPAQAGPGARRIGGISEKSEEINGAGSPRHLLTFHANLK